MKNEPLKCQDTTWLVSDSCERPLTNDEKVALAEHVAQCTLCQSARIQFEVLFKGLESYFQGDKPDPTAK